jgi:hypothetical protein
MTLFAVLVALALGACSLLMEDADTKQLDNGGKQEDSRKPSAPGKPILQANILGLYVSWNAVELAASYHVYYGTAPIPPAEAACSTTETWATISGIQSDTLYYVWVRAENTHGLSPFSEAATITPDLPEPGEPVLTAGGGSINVTWISVGLYYDTYYYNVYCAESETRPAVPAQEHITGTSTVITGLVNDTPYYVWVESVYEGEHQ